jgi:S1-C subfamily serine protease
VIALSFLACGGPDEPEYPDNEIGIAEVGDPEPPSPPRPKGVLYRDEVDATVDRGLGYFLQRVELEPALDNGRFRGFRVAAMHPPEYWEGVDLKPGDVILNVNGMPIERDTQAYAAFVALKKSSELRVEYLRGGQSRALVYRIVPREEAERLPPEKPAAKPTKPPS